MVYKGKKYNSGDTNLKKKYKTKRRVKDLDEINEDIKPENVQKFLNQDVDFDKPGNAQFYCIHCARYFVSNQALQEHFTTKLHKRRLKALEDEPYTIEDSQRAAGQGDKAQKSFVLLTPAVDFDEQLKKKYELLDNIKIRKLDIDIDKVEEKWAFLKNIEEQKNNLEKTKTEIGQTIKALIKNNKENKLSDEIEKLKLHLNIIKQDLRHIKSASYSIEEDANLQVLDLPNCLHSQTPRNALLELYKYLENLDTKSKSHMQIGEDKGYLKCMNLFTIYLKSDAALFEFGIQNYFSTKLLHLNYFQFSNADFVKSVIVEGCGTNPYNSSEVLTIENIHCVKNDAINRLHLVGASSLYSFMAYFTKHQIQTSNFPINAFSIGRKYRTHDKNSTKVLFNTNQTSEVTIFRASVNNFILEDILNEVIQIYQPLGYHFRVVLIPAYELKKTESLRLSIQMFSNYFSRYVEVGHVSFYEDYISKRLLLNYSEGKERMYPYVVSGSLVNIQKLLGCVLENNYVNNEPLLTDILYEYI
ncbi:hypothetical protein GWI33_016490 [Rhynchophorus ferrugineus]|uniref:Zinc finger protein 593 homolog n=1 Tax=Rhynchophorus ferrugineus TaxID=354439 RepID=A0A834I1K5_RHYFE|nr:hypothetical protein GWI33_016490 [Rhynchophorus ferrugineus]